MSPILRFLNALRSLTQSGAIKSIDEAMDFAKREFGQVNDLLKRQIEQVFKRPQGKAPKPGEGGITSIKNAPKKKDETAQASGSIMDQIEASKNKIEGASNRITEIQKEIDQMYKPKPETSPLMERLEKGVDTLKSMKQPGMDPGVGLTRTIARSILNKKGIEVPERVDPIEVLAENFGADVLMDAKNVAEELLELQRMGKGTKSIDEVLEQTGMFDISINKNAPKGISQEQLRQIKKEVDQEKIIKDFDPTDREPNSEGGLNTLMASDDMNERLLEKLYEDFLDQGFSPQEAAKKAREAFSERSNAAMGGRMNFNVGSLPKGIQALVKLINKKFGKGTMKTADEIDPPEKKPEILAREFEAREKANKEMDAIVKDQIEGGFIRDMEKSMQKDMQRELKKPEREILDVPPVPEGFKLSKEKLMAKFPELDEAFADEMVNMDKDTAGRLIKMLENRRLDPEAYDRLLAEFGDTLQFQKEFDKVIRRKKNAEGGLQYLMGM